MSVATSGLPSHVAKNDRQILLYGASAALLGVVLAYGRLITLSRWQADEYLDFAFLRQFGRQFELYRLLHWSPRPWSEALFMIYGAAVNHFHRPLAGSFACMLWGLLALPCLAPAWLGAPDRAARPVRLLLGMAILAACLVGHPVAEVFYWPAGSVAYIPTLAAAIWLFWRVLDGIEGDVTRPLTAGAAVVLAAGCSEVGLFLALCFTGCAALWGVREGVRKLWWLLPGLIVSATLASLLLRGRVGTTEMADTAHTAHHAGASLLAALGPFLRDLGAGNEEAATPTGVLTTLACRALLLAGTRWCLSGQPTQAARRPGAYLPALAAALLLAAFATLAAAYYQFGTSCCQRHETMRQCFIALAFICLGAWSAIRFPRRVPHAAAPASLLLAVLIPFATTLPALAEAYRLYPAAIQARALTWQSGLQTASDSMVLTRGPSGGLIPTGDPVPPGTYVLDKETPWYSLGIFQFFGKTRLRVVQPSPPSNGTS